MKISAIFVNGKSTGTFYLVAASMIKGNAKYPLEVGEKWRYKLLSIPML